MSARILITGASGFVGGALHARLSSDPHLNVLGLGRRALPLANYARVDLSRLFDLAFEPDVVVHVAARSSPWGSAREFHRDNTKATENVVAFCERRGRPRLVYVSTTAVFYRNADQVGLTEASPIGPRYVNAYARTKREGELAVERYGGSWIVMRPRAVFGPGDTTVFPRIVRAARERGLPRLRRAGVAIADLVYIDTLTAYLQRACFSQLGGSYNVTNGEPVETQGLIFDVLARLDIPTRGRPIGARTAMAFAAATEAFYRIALPRREPPVTRFGVAALAYSKTFDVSKLVRDFGAPEVTLAEGIARLVDHLKRTHETGLA